MPVPAATALFAFVAILVLAALGYGIYYYSSSPSNIDTPQTKYPSGGQTPTGIKSETQPETERMSFCPP